jgi:hypothetical protein
MVSSEGIMTMQRKHQTDRGSRKRTLAVRKPMKKKKELNGAPLAKKAIAYARVSTKEQEKEGFSIDAQKKLFVRLR